MDVGGGEVRPLLQTESASLSPFNVFPRWSPDGRFVAFAHFGTAKPGSTAIYTVNQDGRDPRKLTNRAGHEVPYGFCPDGESIVFGYVQREVELEELYIMDIDGSNRRRLTNSEGRNSAASWSPRFSTRK